MNIENRLEYCNLQNSLLKGSPKEKQVLMYKKTKILLMIHSFIHSLTHSSVCLCIPLFSKDFSRYYSLENMLDTMAILVSKTTILVLIEFTIYWKLSKFAMLRNGPIDWIGSDDFYPALYTESCAVILLPQHHFTCPTLNLVLIVFICLECPELFTYWLRQYFPFL